MVKNILLITDATQQYYWQPFVEACEKCAVEIFVFDTSLFPSQRTISLVMEGGGQFAGSIEVEQRKGDQGNVANLELKTFDTAWYLRPGGPVPDVAMNELETQFTKDEARFVLKTLFGALECNWINRMDAIERAETSKFYQQTLAAQCGLAVPQTLISNDPQEVLVFCEQMNGVLVKTLGFTELGDDNSHFIYSQRFNLDEIAAAATSIAACPVFCQQYIEKRYEYRVVAAGEQFLACRIDSQASSATKVDWRHYDFDNVEHKQVKLPDLVRSQIHDFMEAIDLRYGALDMIETPDGDFVFLEINPSGQWQWLQHYGGLQVPEAVADMLSAV